MGSLLTLHTNHSHVSNFNGAVLESQTCERGLGADLKASTSGLFSLAAQYGIPLADGPLQLTLTPKLGIGYVARPVPEETSQTNFSLGADLIAGYGDARVSAGYWHMSNANLGARNAGIDLLTVMVGWRFH